ncbi:MAG: hypothetical protein K2M25_02455 [Muribaculaceae bacterium]|nr:hypothetical protein [Muribaculaceae bacterium]
MKFDKEYPATHSMATAWFGIDNEGNVAIINFNDNGPVPVGCGHGDYHASEIITDQMASPEPDGSKNMKYSDTQAELLEQKLKSPTIDDLDFELLVRVTHNLLDKFKSLCRKYKNDYNEAPFVTVNENRGLFITSFYNWSKEDKKYILDNNIISGIADTYILFEDNWDSEKNKWVFSHRMDGYPYFLYQQPYSVDDLTKRTYVPSIPFKETQLSERGRKMALRFPLSFRETPAVQIEKYFQSTGPDNHCVDYDGIRETPVFILPDEDGKMMRFRRSNLGNPNCEFCLKCYLPENYYYNKFTISQYGFYPTMLRLVSPMDYAEGLTIMPKPYEELGLIRENLERLIILPILPGIPVSGEERYYISDEELKEIIKKQDMNVWFSNCKDNFIESIRALAPQVIISSTHVNDILKNFFSIEDNKITIEDTVYPYFILDKEGKYLNKIIELSKLPFRGVCPERITPQNKDE